MTHIFDLDGQLLQVQYHRDHDGVPVFRSIRMLGENYRATGPELLPMICNMLTWVIPGEMVGPVMDRIIEDIPA